MNPLRVLRQMEEVRVPRRRGDEPGTIQAEELRGQRSPQARG
ncbi:MAG: hypothetical protein XXXNARYT_003133 [Candidatus Accumulibacter regalis]